MRRTRLARMAEEALSILQSQRKTLALSKQLDALKDLETQETATLSAIESQRGVGKQFLELNKDLAEISGWGPPFGPAAADGLRVLRAHRVLDHLTSAVRQLSGEDLARPRRDAGNNGIPHS